MHHGSNGAPYKSEKTGHFLMRFFSKFASVEIRYQIYIAAFENLSFVSSLASFLSVFRQSFFHLE